MKNLKNKLPSTKETICPRCGVKTLHSLYNEIEKLYKCNICKTVHKL